jgi:hypothetical protein
MQPKSVNVQGALAIVVPPLPAFCAARKRQCPLERMAVVSFHRALGGRRQRSIDTVVVALLTMDLLAGTVLNLYNRLT